MANADGLRAAIERLAEERFAAGVAGMVDAVKEAAPRDSGVLAASVGEAGRSSTPGRMETVLVAPVEYASYQDQGTGIYGPKGVPIRPVNARVLAWEGTAQQAGFGYPGAGKTASGMVFAAEVAGSPATGFWSDNVTSEGWSSALGA